MPIPLLWIVGYVVNPDTVFPVTPIDIGFVPLTTVLEPSENLPHEYFPTGLSIFPVVTRPTMLEFESTLQVKIPTVELLDQLEIFSYFLG